MWVYFRSKQPHSYSYTHPAVSSKTLLKPTQLSIVINCIFLTAIVECVHKCKNIFSLLSKLKVFIDHGDVYIYFFTFNTSSVQHQYILVPKLFRKTFLLNSKLGIACSFKVVTFRFPERKEKPNKNLDITLNYALQPVLQLANVFIQ